MKLKMFLPLVILAIGITAFKGETEKYPTIEIGSKAPMPDYKMKDVTGKDISLESINNKNGVCVIFSCNTCPFVVGRGDDNEGWEGRYNAIAEKCIQNKIGIVLVNSNEAKREGDDSMKAMQERATSQKYVAHYVEDKDSQLANAFGAKTTPHVFLFNGDMQLVYKGAIDDNNASAKEVKKNFLADAITKLAAGETIEPNSTKALGCSIKRN